MRVLLSIATAAVASAGARPKFPDSWSAMIQQDMVQFQGNYQLPNGDYCCSIDSNDCQIQVQSQAGMTYFSLPTNQTSQVFGPEYTPYAIVDDFNLEKEMAVDKNFTCTSWCPLGGKMPPFNTAGYTDGGATTINGIPVELWQQVTEIPILNITMETDNFYVNQTDMENANPIIDVDDLTPAGEFIGQSNTTYTQWVAGPQSSKWFTVYGVDKCPKAKGCNQDSVRQLHRLAMGRKADYIMAHFAAKMERAEAAAAEAKQMMHLLSQAE